jgi:hypothetical protein
MSSIITPYDIYQYIKTKCSNKIKFKSTLPDYIWESLNIFRDLPDYKGVRGTISCDNLPEFEYPRDIVGYIYAFVTSSDDNSFNQQLNKYRDLIEVAQQIFSYNGGTDDIKQNPLIDVGIVLLGDNLSKLSSPEGSLDALTKISELLPKQLKDQFDNSLLDYSKISSQQIAKKQTRKNITVRDEKEERAIKAVTPLVENTIEYCSTFNKDFSNISTNSVLRFLIPKLVKENVDLSQIDKVDPHEIDCTSMYRQAENAVATYSPNVRNLIFNNKLAQLLADQLYDQIVKKSKTMTITTKEEVESELKRYEQLQREEERQLEVIEEVLNKIYSYFKGERTNIGISGQKLYEFLQEYLYILNEAGLSPQQYQLLGKMVSAFVEILNEAGLSPQQYDKIFEKIVILPDNVKRTVAKALIDILSAYQKGEITQQQALDAVMSVIGIEQKSVQQEPQTTRSPTNITGTSITSTSYILPPTGTSTANPSMPTLPRSRKQTTEEISKRAKKQEEKEEEEKEEEINAELLDTIKSLSKEGYRVLTTKEMLIKYIKEYNIHNAMFIAYDSAFIIIIPASESGSKKPSAIYVSPDFTNKFLTLIDNTLSLYKQSGMYNYKYFGDLIGAEVSVDKIEGTNINLIVTTPVVLIQRYGYSKLIFIKRIDTINYCIVYINNGKFYGVLPNCGMNYKPGSLLSMTPEEITLYAERK